MKKMNNAKLGFILSTVGLIIACINLIMSKGEGTSTVLFCSLITIWICNLENCKKSHNGKDE